LSPRRGSDRSYCNPRLTPWATFYRCSAATGRRSQKPTCGLTVFAFMPIADLRRSYTLAGLRRADLSPDPIAQFNKWLQQAIDAQLLEPTAMTLATTDKNLRSSARIVLLKGLDKRGFVFYTNYESRKARELLENPQGTLLFS